MITESNAGGEMLGSTVLDVVIALFFVFFVFSLLVSGINEGVRKLLNTRSKVLWASIRRMLDETTAIDEVAEPDELSASSDPGLLAKPTAARRVGLDPRLPAEPRRGEVSGVALFDQLFHHPLVANLDPAVRGDATRIAHLPPRVFARAMVDILAPRDETDARAWNRLEETVADLPASVRSQLEILLAEARGDVGELRRGIEEWFNSSMERVSRWYEKRTRKVMAVYGLIVAGLFNVSAVVITADLYEDDILRNTVVSLAESQATAPSTLTDAPCADRLCIEDQVNALVETRLPVLWRQCDIAGGEARLCGFESNSRWAATLIGWMVTAAALSMGASFWFSILKKAFKVREVSPV